MAIAFSGNVVTFLDGGQTRHSAFKLPLDFHKKPGAMCTIEKSGLATVFTKESNHNQMSVLLVNSALLGVPICQKGYCKSLASGSPLFLRKQRG
ncbi:hypothetical protein TNCV_2414211 [Trichonephila clavipes]|nr:hypothetical protein TNCV_2414211 [Trichonephila clavipes]